MSDSTTTAFLADHPKMIGVLFTIMLIMSTTGVAAAGASSTFTGP
jgi:hypothetical protein